MFNFSLTSVEKTVSASENSQDSPKPSSWRGRVVELRGKIESEERLMPSSQATMPQTPRGMRYEDLSPSHKCELRKKIIKENFPYAVYMSGEVRKNVDEDVDGIQFSFDLETERLKWWGISTLITSIQKNILLNITKSLLSIEMGFKVDELGNFYHLTTGTIFNLIYDGKKKELSICFMGLDSASRLKIPKNQQGKINAAAAKAAFFNSLGNVPEAVIQAIAIGDLIKKTIRGTDIQVVMIGHSYGGTLAQVAALSSGLKGVIFNAAPLGTGTKDKIDELISKEKRKEYAQQIYAFSVKEDWLTDGLIGDFCRRGRDLGLPVPTVMGRGYQLPKVGGNLKDVHCHFLRAFKELKSLEGKSESS